MVKRIASVILTVILISMFWLNVCSANIVIDGRSNEQAWVDSYGEILVSSKDVSNCAVEFASFATKVDYDNSIIYFSFKVIVDGLVDESTSHGVSVDVNNSGAVRITRDSVSEYNTVYYSYDAALCEYSSTDFCVETAIGIKHGIDTVYDIKVQFIDGNGDYSNEYSVSLPQPPVEETTTLIFTEPYFSQSEEYTESKTTAVKTTEKKTTAKRTTTRKATTERTTVQKTEKLTVKQTEKTTKAPKTTKETKDTTVKIVTVYVLVTAKTDKETTAEKTEQIAVSTETQSINDNDDTFKVRKEIAYIGVAVLLIVTFGVCVMVNMSHDKNDDDKN